MPNDEQKKHDRRKDITDLWEQNLTPAEIGRRMGLSEGWVKQIPQLYGLTQATGRDKRPLSRRQLRMLAFLQDFTARHPYAPTLREIVKCCSGRSTSVAFYNLRLLERGKPDPGSRHLQGDSTDGAGPV